MAQVYFDDVKEGQDIPTLEKTPTNRTLVQWAGASGDFFELHYDKEFAKTMGYPNVLVHADLSRLPDPALDRLGRREGRGQEDERPVSRQRLPRTEAALQGKVTKKYQKGNESIVELEIFVENPEGKQITLAPLLSLCPRNKLDLHKDQTLGGKTQGRSALVTGAGRGLARR